MLAAHRDQENLVHSRQVPGKQHPKTPGAKYPKTPSRFGQNDENAPTVFAGQKGIGGAKTGGNDKIMTTKANGNRQAMMTPMEPRSRAPLGNKTTNAKARAGPAGAVKEMVKEIEKTQTKATTVQKPKQRSADAVPQQTGAKPDRVKKQDEEPEYAPPRPADLPYESDLLPEGGLTFEGLKKENLFKGFYEHFYDPVDDNGISRRERRFNDEMTAVMNKAVERNDRDMEALNWGISEPAEVKPRLIRQKPDEPNVAEAKMAQKVRGRVDQKRPGTITSRKAASALAIHSDNNNKAAATKPISTVPVARRPLSSLIPGQRNSKPPTNAKPESASNATGEAASRTTIGYNKGKSASSMMRRPQHSKANLERRSKLPATLADEQDLTITPARVRRDEVGIGPKEETESRPQFMAIFEQEDEDDLPPMAGPLGGDEDEEEFQLDLDL